MCTSRRSPSRRATLARMQARLRAGPIDCVTEAIAPFARAVELNPRLFDRDGGAATEPPRRLVAGDPKFRSGCRNLATALMHQGDRVGR